MADPLQAPPPPRSQGDGIPNLAIGVAWTAVVLSVLAIHGVPGLLSVALILAAVGVTLVVGRMVELRRWIRPIRHLAEDMAAATEEPNAPFEPIAPLELDELAVAMIEAKRAWAEASRLRASAAYYREMIAGGGVGPAAPQRPNSAMTRSGLLATLPRGRDDRRDPNLSGEIASTEMISRLDPATLRWIDSSPAEQVFLGWDLAALHERSFLDVVHPDDHPRVKEQVAAALEKGEAHGLTVRIRTARGLPKAVEMSIGARYGPDMAVTHLRCHLRDVTDKIKAEREIRLRTRELTQVNEQLRQINRELEELKDRYRDLYQNAPAMYYSLDPQGRLLDCNDTLLETLGYSREFLVGRMLGEILADSHRAGFEERHEMLVRRGTLEIASRWVKAGGEPIDVWIAATAVRGRDGKFLHTRSVAQDITARNRLEAELKEKNDRLARTNEELSRKNREMDEFAYVVSHDLQEPLRTLIAFSDFLMKDYGDLLDADGQEYVRYLVEASRRMRALIQGLLHLSRAGRVTGEIEPVNLGEVVDVVRADLAELIRSKRAEVRVEGTLPTVFGDRDRLGQLLSNLIGNGLKYNRAEAPRVEVGTLTHEPGAAPWVTLFIRDNGIGIEPQFHARIFQLFRRLHTREEFEGTGAGLAICQKIVQAHGGRIWVESTPNEGATFFVSLPRHPLRAPTPIPTPIQTPEPETQVPHAS